MIGEPAAFAVYVDDRQVSSIMSQRRALDWVQRNYPEVELRDALRMIRPTLDERDSALRAERQAKRDALPRGPLEGDVVRFADGVEYRVSHVHPRLDGGHSVQTTAGGSFSWASTGHLSYSGSLFHPFDSRMMSLAGEMADVPAWFFHHGHAAAHNAVHTTARVRVWTTTVDRSAVR